MSLVFVGGVVILILPMVTTLTLILMVTTVVIAMAEVTTGSMKAVVKVMIVTLDHPHHHPGYANPSVWRVGDERY